MMETCSTCKHWSDTWWVYDDMRNYIPSETHRVCKRISVGTRVNDVIEDIAMMYEGAGDNTLFVPRLDFGCNQHEAKE